MCSVSIVLPSYNGEKYLEESINSILRQTFTDWELILVDDCSDDGTLPIMERYANMDDRIKLIRNKQNMNLPNSLNIGFSQAEGKYFSWTSDDNIYYENAFEEMHKYMESHKEVYLVCADMVYIDDRGDFICEAPTYDEQWFWYNGRLGACFMYRAEVVKKIGKYNTKLFGAEDFDYWIRIKKHYGGINRLDKVLYQYRIHGGSLSAKLFYEIKERVFNIRKENLQLILNNLEDNVLKTAIWFEMIAFGYSLDNYKEKFQIDEIDFFKDFDEYNDRIIIYGAGVYGGKVNELLMGKIIGFVDLDPNKIGTIYEGKQVYSIEDVNSKFEDCQIVVAVDATKLYDIAQLYNNRFIMTTFYQMFAKIDLINKNYDKG